MENIVKRLAGYIVANRNSHNHDEDFEESVDLVINRFSHQCYWEQDEFCVNDSSEHVADFAFPSRCGACKYFQPKNK